MELKLATFMLFSSYLGGKVYDVMSTLMSRYFDRFTVAWVGMGSGGECLLRLLTIQMIDDLVSESVTGIF